MFGGRESVEEGERVLGGSDRQRQRQRSLLENQEKKLKSYKRNNHFSNLEWEKIC